MPETKVWDIIILGSGPAGMSAAIYAARAKRSTLVLAGDTPALLSLAMEVEDYPGFESIKGAELVEKMKTQAEKHGTKIVAEGCTKVDFKKHPFKLYTSEGTYQARAVILATGASPKFLGVENEKKLIGKGVSTCAICDGWFFKGKHVAVIGGGDTAIREATYLSKLAKDVTVIHRRDELRAQAALQDRARSIPNIKFIWNTHVTGFIGSSRLEALRLENCKTGKIEKFPIDGAFVAIGHEPNTEFLGTALELDKKTYVVLRNRTMTSVDGVFAAGDVADYRYMQAITAAGSGCAAALDANEWLERKDTLKRNSHSH